MFRALTSPRMLGLHLVAIIGTTAAILLGIWQYHAWQVNRQDQALALTRTAPVRLGSVITGDSPFPGNAVGQPVTLAGRWLPGDTLFVSDRSLHGRTGYWVVTPVAVCPASADCAKSSAMLVVRGWTPRPKDAPPEPSGRVAVSGWLQPPDGSGLQDPHPHDDVLVEMRIASAIPHVRQDLYGGYVIAKTVSPSSADAAGTLKAITPASLPRPDTFTSVRNLLYALEWWVFGGFAVFLWWRWCSDELKRFSEGEGPTTESTSPQDAEVASNP